MLSQQPPFFVIPVRDTGIQVSIFYTHQISLLAKVSWIPDWNDIVYYISHYID
ncbi:MULTISPECIES: hypothetical protein [Wolbachia]|uniref:Uncharacterized protein n=1 Tax=Wolbachia pipientis TaxID=955 RepID=A0A7G5CD92_WOLPI|nr:MULTISPECIES: hypothetical protein [Wolbachia]MDE5062423.1 hypothetical protein [Wolbachia endosymbiont of Drosophila tsacasi]QMV47176.1 hypothetical protein HC356_03970 [Wolbachia pipientis]